jgi:hypothetical protein
MAKRKTTAKKASSAGAKNSLDKMKYEIANEFGVNLGPDASSRSNGAVGGEITKRLVENGMNKTTSSSTTSSKKSSSKKSRSKKTDK